MNTSLKIPMNAEWRLSEQRSRAFVWARSTSRTPTSKSKNGEAFVVGMHISPYEKGNIFNRDPFRERKLLLHKREILKLLTLSQADGYSLIPLRLYLKDGKVKLELAVAKGKKLYDKRHDIAERDAKRAMDRRNADAY